MRGCRRSSGYGTPQICSAMLKVYLPVRCKYDTMATRMRLWIRSENDTYNDRVGTYTGIIASRYPEGFLGPLLVVQFDIRNFSSKKLS